jgi:hypothetical protein
METSPQWTTQPEAARVIAGLLLAACERSPRLAALEQRLRDETATRLVDWLDHLAVSPQPGVEAHWREVGFTVTSRDGVMLWQHPGGRFPCLVSDPGLNPADGIVVGLAVESVTDAISALRGEGDPEGEPLAAFRQARLWQEGGILVRAIERHGWSGMALPRPRRPEIVVRVQEAFRLRKRSFVDPEDGFTELHRLIDRAIADLGRDEACERFFVAERDFWQHRNRAARIQKGRQDALGLGWANHDHHTYRSSRRWYTSLIAVLEKLGLQCRERFHAGAEAGWGAQVLEHPVTGVVVFADVDLAPEEIASDIAHTPLPHLPRLGTIGLWCALHGEAMLEAGMHHLECTFVHDELTLQLAGFGIAMMKPFTDFPHLKQAFTVGERWPVAEDRLEHLLIQGAITVEQAATFRSEGALGSHLENLERNQGFKGFNQHGVSKIITGTDPRRA